ncbi:hypothetical protein G7Z17_g4979 [Cylindrodendrum hubeiense]|uniref:Phytanoyl-CoA dioxygenase n=1 Tax=Cylindrodendrum hubeiense TaxID=595255 RepID=A0A9P5HDW5_9HYPO|nr:hypothetical protein G7Z17_g4979 [Cylindrodendrum hubeiense]
MTGVLRNIDSLPTRPESYHASKQQDPKSPQKDKLTLHGNGGIIDDVGELTPCYPDTPIEEIRRRYWQEGVVWVKGLLDPDVVNKCRKEYFSMVNEGTGILKPETDPVEGIFSGGDWREFLLPGAVRVAAGLKDDGPFVENAIKSHVAPFYQNFKRYAGQQLEPFVGKLCEFEDPCTLRSNLPSGRPPTSITAWVPIGDIGLHDGGLIYLDRAHDIGVKYEDDFSKKNADLSDEERLSAFNRNMSKGGWIDKNAATFGEDWSRKWYTGKYEAGDVVFHTPMTIHAGAMNKSATGRIRCSTDLRFVDKTKPSRDREIF